MRLIIDNSENTPCLRYWAMDFTRHEDSVLNMKTLYGITFHFEILNRSFEYANFAGKTYQSKKDFGSIEDLAQDLEYAKKHGFSLQMNWNMPDNNNNNNNNQSVLWGQYRLYNELNISPVNISRSLSNKELRMLRKIRHQYVPKRVEYPRLETEQFANLSR